MIHVGYTFFPISSGNITITTPFDVVAAEFFCTGFETGGKVDSTRYCFARGAAAQAGGQWCAAHNNIQPVPQQNDTSSLFRSDAVLGINATSSDLTAPTMLASISSWTSSSIVLACTKTVTTQAKIHYILYGGPTCNASCGTWTLNSSGASTTVSGLPFRPQYLRSAGAITAVAADSRYSSGVSDGTNQWADAVYLPQSNQRAFANLDASAITKSGDANWRGTVAFNSDGFTVTVTTAPPSDVSHGYLVLQDTVGHFTVGTHAWPNPIDGGTAPFTHQVSTPITFTPGYEPEGLQITSSQISNSSTSFGGLQCGIISNGAVATSGVASFISASAMSNPGAVWTPSKITAQSIHTPFDGTVFLEDWIPDHTFAGGGDDGLALTIAKAGDATWAPDGVTFDQVMPNHAPGCVFPADYPKPYGYCIMRLSPYPGRAAQIIRYV